MSELLRGEGLRAGIDGRLKYIYDFNRDSGELYDLGHDPGEQTDVSASNAEQSSLYKAMVQAFAREQQAKRAETGETPTTPEELEKLRGLGYVR
jgi:arylsulfatase A-like enzyme